MSRLYSCFCVIGLAVLLAGCAPPSINFARVHCRPIQNIGSLDGVVFGADIDTYGYSGHQLVYRVVLLDNTGRPILFVDVMTGLHGLHVVAGIVLLFIMLCLTARDNINVKDFVKLENSGLYWHLVDVIWIYLFPLFYLIT